jgi:flagellar biosynthesis protein
MSSQRQLAVALKYDRHTSGAPRLVAKGWDDVARKIMAAAGQKGVPVREEPDLAQVLSRLDLGQEISPALYEAVARVLAFIYRMNQEAI